MIPADKMKIPDRAGVKITTWDWIRLLFTVLIPRIPIIISNRPSKADERVKSVSRLPFDAQNSRCTHKELSLLVSLRRKRNTRRLGLLGKNIF